jgi:hypothetical protein
MKKLMVFMLSVVLLGSCVTVSRYSGEIYPANVTFERPNFKYIKTVTGTSDATFNGYGWDIKKVNGIVNEAKQNLYNQLKLKENQAPTNFTLDFVRVGKPTGQYLVLRKLKAVLTADIFEFSSDGTYLDNQETIVSKGQKNESPIVTNDDRFVNKNLDSKYTKYSKDPELNDVVYYIDFYTKKYIKSKVTKLTQSNFIRVEYKSSTGKLKTRNIDTNLLFQIKD